MYNFDMIWHEIICWFLRIDQDWKRFAAQEHRIVFVLISSLDVQNNFVFPTCKNSQKWVKSQKSTDKQLSFDGLIQEDIDLSDIYLAVCDFFQLLT